MTFTDELLNVDYLVYSCHKTATQSLVATLHSNGFVSAHYHYLYNIGLKSGDFRGYLKSYLKKNKKN